MTRRSPILTLFLALLLWSWAGPALALPHPYFSKHPDQAKQLETLLSRTSLKALEPQPADLSLSLSDLKGNAYALEKHRGQVLMLTRWATWCSACKAEMPFKIKLHKAIGSDRFALIGISNEARDTVASYQQQSPSHYPTSLLDPQGLMQKFFPGGAIPVTILIDGWGWVVAMKTGGAQWDTTPYQELTRFLIKLAPSKAALKRREKAPAPQVAFAKKIQVRKGQTFAVTFAMRWLGERDKYARLMFRLPKEKGLRVLGVETSGITEDNKGGNRRTYTLRMKAVNAGTITLDPILLTYWLKDYDNHFQVPIGELEIRVAGLLPTSARKMPTWALGTLGAALLLFLCAIVVVRKKRKPAQSDGNDEQIDEDALDEALQRLLQGHNDEDWKAVLTTMRAIWRELLRDKDSGLNELEEAFRYGGQAPSRDALKAALDRLYRALRDDAPTQAERLKPLL